MMHSDEIFNTLLKALAQYNSKLPMMMMAVPDRQRYINMACEYNIDLIFEAFIDRSYQKNGRLTARSAPRAVHTNTEDIINQAHTLITDKNLTSVCGQNIVVDADTICIHGDGELALDIAKQLREKLAI